jgi:hypothetical protein
VWEETHDPGCWVVEQFVGSFVEVPFAFRVQFRKQTLSEPYTMVLPASSSLILPASTFLSDGVSELD